MQSMCFQTRHGSETVIVDSVFIMNLTTAARSSNGWPRTRALERNDRVAIWCPQLNGGRCSSSYETRKLQLPWFTLSFLPILSYSTAMMSKRIITLEFNKTICYSVKANMWLLAVCLFGAPAWNRTGVDFWAQNGDDVQSQRAAWQRGVTARAGKPAVVVVPPCSQRVEARRQSEAKACWSIFRHQVHGLWLGVPTIPGGLAPSPQQFPCSCGCSHTRTAAQEGIMPLFLLRSAIVRRLWLDTRLLLASFLRRSRKVSSVCPWPFGLPTTLPGRSGRTLQADARWAAFKLPTVSARISSWYTWLL